METFKKVKKVVFDIYLGIGAAALGFLACSVIYTVLMRYIFGKSYSGLSEFNILLFAFTTFWGIGINILKEEHIIIDIWFDTLKPTAKKIFSLINYSIVLIVLCIFTYLSYKYTMMAGKQISMGMHIPMYFFYGVMPVTGVLAIISCVFKLIDFATCDMSRFHSKHQVLKKEDKAVEGEN